MNKNTDIQEYFFRLGEYSRSLLDRLPIPDQIQPIAVTFNTLKPAMERGRPEELRRLKALSRPTVPGAASDVPPAGMNTIGILADRLTILICKEWYLRHRQNRRELADQVAQEQIPDIVACLAQVSPGHASLLEKVSSIQVDWPVLDFDEAYYGLLTANLLMWETQEMLYTRDMEAVPAEELRDYIRFFSQANMMRNACISASERLYWAAT